jgi:hypothetical protein
MNRHLISALITASVLLPLALGGCGGGYNGSGTLGDHCRQISLGQPNACVNDHLTCIDTYCQACGGANQPCCGVGHVCDGALFCDSPGGHGFACTACGQPGQPCCTNNYCSGGTCNTGTQRCQGASGSCTGSTSYPVGVVNRASRCYVTMQSQAADSAAAARTCVQDMLDRSGSPYTTADGTLLEQPYCVTNEHSQQNTVHPEAYSMDDLHTCALSQCGVGCTATEGACM